MDKELESGQGKAIDNAAWENTITEFLNLRNQFPTLANISLCLPLGLKKENDLVQYWDRGSENSKNLVYEPCIIETSDFKNPCVFPIQLQHKIVRSGRKVVALEQTFETVKLHKAMTQRRAGRVRTVKTCMFDTNQHISKKNGYYYRWGNNGDLVRISKLIGTTSINRIKQQGSDLVNECLRFIFMYCQG